MSGRTAQQLLDAVHSLAQLEALDLDEHERRLGAELAPHGEPSLAGLEQVDAALRAALVAIDGFASRAMRIRLDHRLAGDTSVATPLRKVLAGTITSYEGQLELLHERVAGAAARVDPGRAPETATAVVEVAREVLAIRELLRSGVLVVARELAAAHLPAARQAARDRTLDEALRRRWLAARRDLEQVADAPAAIVAAPMAERLKALVEPDEPLEATPEPTRGELIELD